MDYSTINKILIFITAVTLSSNGLAEKVAKEGEVISTNKINASIAQLGGIKQSLLTTQKIQSLHGDCLVKMAGQSIAGSELAVPNASGLFLRDLEYFVPKLN